MKLTLKKIYRNKKDKDGNPLLNKDGKPYERINLLTKEYPDNEYVSGFGDYRTDEWKEGDEVNLDVSVVIGKNGKEYRNFRIPNKTSELETRVTICENSIASMKSSLNTLMGNEIQEEIDESAMDADKAEAEEVIDVSNIPF